MSDGTSTQSTTEQGKPRKGTGPLGRSQLEQHLRRELDAGATHLRNQIRYLLALSQMVPPPTAPKNYTQKPLTITQARLMTLEDLAGALNQEQLEQLVTDIEQIADTGVRLVLLARMALHLPATSYRTVVRDIWNQVDDIPDPVVRAQVLLEIAPLMTLANDEPATPSALLHIVSYAQSIKNTEARLRSLTALAPQLPYVMSMRMFRRVVDEVKDVPNDGLRAKAIVTLAATLPTDLLKQALLTAQSINAPAERARALTALVRKLPQENQAQLRLQTLDTIDRIESEEERTDALVSFAPCLETEAADDQFPAALKKALAIAVAISRKQVRARALVALAPYLTSDLQGETLAAVHSLDSERDRAMLLAQLAPNLPPELLVASLAVAHTMREQDARVSALSVLAHHVPQNARSQTLLDALAAASNLPHHFERVRALVALFDILPQHLLEQALTNALETTRLIDNENARARALNLLGEHLPEKLLLRALQVAQEIQNPQQRLNALLGFIARLPGNKQHEAMFEILGCAQQMPLEYKQARALVSIAPNLSTDMLKEVEAMVDGFDDPFDQISVYIAIIQNMPPEERPPVIQKTWGKINTIEDGYDRASSISALAPHLPETAASDISRAVQAAVSIIEDEYDRASAISILAPLLTDSENDSVAGLPDSHAAVKHGIEIALAIPIQSLRVDLLRDAINLWVGGGDLERSYRLWQSIILRLVNLPLADVLLCLGALLPLIQEIGDEDALEEVAHILGVR